MTRGSTPTQQKGRPIDELPIPAEVTAAGTMAIEAYRDEHRLGLSKTKPW